MTRGKPNKRYTPEFKIMVVETMHREKLSSYETAQQFEIQHQRISDWERIYLEEGKEAFFIERRGRKSAGRPVKLDKKVEEDLIGEVQRLRAENAYLKKLNACPGAEFVGTGVLKDFTLTFKGDNSGVADIIPCVGGRVPIGVWRISPADERRLDIYEGFPRLYGKRAVRALCGGKPVDGLYNVRAKARKTAVRNVFQRDPRRLFRLRY